jgi:hypothetical protein
MDSPAARRQQSGSLSPIDKSQFPAIQQRKQNSTMPLNPLLVSIGQAQAFINQPQKPIGDLSEVWLKEKDVKNLFLKGIQFYLEQYERNIMQRKNKARLLSLIKKRHYSDITTDEWDQDEVRDHPRSFSTAKMQLPTLKYKGTSSSELTTFLYNLELRYSVAPYDFQTEASKIAYAVACFQGPVKRR